MHFDGGLSALPIVEQMLWERHAVRQEQRRVLLLCARAALLLPRHPVVQHQLIRRKREQRVRQRRVADNDVVLSTYLHPDALCGSVQVHQKEARSARAP
jgi:hypothetical protein